MHEILLSVLREAVSSDHTRVAASQAQLSQMESMDGFFFALLEIGTCREIDENVRWISLIYFKNGVEQLWKRAPARGISEEQRKKIRLKLGAVFEETSVKLAKQLSITIAKIIRRDFPQDWPLFFENVASMAMREGVEQQRALEVLKDSLKVMETKCLPNNRIQLANEVCKIFHSIFDLWMRCKTEECIVNYLSLKCWRLIMTLMIKADRQRLDENTIGMIGKMFCEPINTCWSIDFASKYQKQFFILFLNCSKQKENYVKLVSVFSACIANSINQGNLIASNKGYNNELIRRFLEYSASSEGRNCIALSIQNPNLLKDLMGAFLNNLSYSSEDMAKWQLDPEEFFNEDESECSDDKEKGPLLFAQFLKKYHPALLNHFIESSVQSIQNSGEINDGLLKGLEIAGTHLTPQQMSLLFEVILQNSAKIKGEASIKRLLEMMVEWIKLGLPGSEARMKIYSFLSQVIRDSSIVLQLTAAKCIGRCIDEDWELCVELIVPLLSSSLHSMLKLMKKLESADNQMIVLNSLFAIIDTIRRTKGEKEKFLPFISLIVTELLGLWSDLNNLAQSISLVIFTKSIQLQNISSALFRCIIRECVNLQNDSHVYLLEDGLSLWKAILIHSNGLSDDLMELYPLLFPLLALTNETLSTSLSILESYCYFQNSFMIPSTTAFLQDHLIPILSNLTSSSIFMIARVVDLFFSIFKCLPSNTEDLVNFCNHQIANSDDFALINSYAIVLSRIILSCPQVCTLSSFNCTHKWIDFFDCLPNIKYKRSVGLAILMLFKYHKADNSNDYITSICMSLLEKEETLPQEEDFEHAEHQRKSLVIDFDKDDLFLSTLQRFLSEMQGYFNEEQMKEIFN